MHISFNRKGKHTYARFRDGSAEFHLGASKADAIRTLERTWRNHNYLERGNTPEQLNALIQKINENMRR